MKDALNELKQAEAKLREPQEWFRQARKERLRFEKRKTLLGETYHVVKSGVLWIPPFVGPSPFFQKPKSQSRPRCVCPECGAKHAKKV